MNLTERYKFRGKRLDNGEWVDGSLVIEGDRAFMFQKLNDHIKRDDYEVYMIAVDPSTVGQFTNLYDKNNKPIYEGDKDSTGRFVEYSVSMGAFYIGSMMLSEAHIYREFTGTIHDQK